MSARPNVPERRKRCGGRAGGGSRRGGEGEGVEEDIENALPSCLFNEGRQHTISGQSKTPVKSKILSNKIDERVRCKEDLGSRRFTLRGGYRTRRDLVAVMSGSHEVLVDWKGDRPSS